MKMDKIIKQAQRMQAQMALAQEELQNTVLEAAALLRRRPTDMATSSP